MLLCTRRRLPLYFCIASQLDLIELSFYSYDLMKVECCIILPRGKSLTNMAIYSRCFFEKTKLASKSEKKLFLTNDFVSGTGDNHFN